MSTIDFGKFVINRLATLVSFDNTGTDIAGSNVASALIELANRHFGKHAGLARQNPNFQETTGVFQDALVLNIPNAKAGDYVLFWSYRSNNSKSNTNNITEARFNDLALVTNTVLGNTTSVQTPLGGGLGEQFSGFAEFSIVDLPNLKLSLAIQRTVGNGAARINTMNLFCFRVR